MKSKGVALCLLGLVILVAGAIVLYWAYLPRWARMSDRSLPRIKWKQTLPDRFTDSPVVASDGSLYVATYVAAYGGAVYALDRSGAVQWAYRLDSSPSGLLLDGDSNLYFSGPKNVLSLTASGKKRWEAECSPGKTFGKVEGTALGEGVLYASCGENFSALSTVDGHELWRLPIFEWNMRPVVLNGEMVVSTHDWSVLAVDANGNKLWDFPPPNYEPRPKRPGLVTDQPFFSSPIAVGADGSLYVGSGDGEFSAFSPQGALKWTYDGGALRGIIFAASPVIASDDTVIAVSTQATVYAFTPDGAVRWSVHVGEPLKNLTQPSPVLASDGTIYVLALQKIVALSPEGKTIWEFSLPADAFVAQTLGPDGTLYVETGDGILYAVQTADKGLMNSPWPKYQHDLSNSGRAGSVSAK